VWNLFLKKKCFKPVINLVARICTSSSNIIFFKRILYYLKMYYVCFSIPHSVSMKVPRTVISRNWSNFDAAQYELELSATELATTLSDDVDYLFSLYNMTLTELIDKHAPQRKTVRKKQHHAPWFDGECYVARREVRRLERIHRRQRTPACHRSWRAAVARYQQFLGAKQRSYYSGCIMGQCG